MIREVLVVAGALSPLLLLAQSWPAALACMGLIGLGAWAASYPTRFR